MYGSVVTMVLWSFATPWRLYNSFIIQTHASMVHIMETSQSLAIESFSYSWLSDKKPSLDYLDESPRGSIGDYYEDYSNSFLTDQNFNFDATAQTHEPVIHADELFTNGFIRAVFVDPSQRYPCNTLEDSVQTQISSPFSSRNDTPTGRVHIHCSSMRKYGKSTKKALRDLFKHVRPLCYKLMCLRKSTRVDDIERRIMWKAKGWNSSPQASSQQMYTSMGRDSCHLENSIYEAVLHCKRSIEK